MSAAISVSDAGSAAVLLGTFDQANRWFLTKHLHELVGDVIIDCRQVESLDDASVAALREFCHRAAAEQRRVVVRLLAPASHSTRISESR